MSNACFPPCDKQTEEYFNLIERMLRHMHKKTDPTPIMNEVRSRHSSAVSLSQTSRHIWQEMGARPNDAMLFSIMPEIARYTMLSAQPDKPDMDRLVNAARYLRVNFLGLTRERFYVSCINRLGRMKAHIMLNEGTSDTSLLSLNAMLAEIIHIKPYGVILSHNHPGGCLRPSPEDIICTVEAMRALSIIRVPLLDHVIVSGRNVVSIRENGFISESKWLLQADTNRYLHNWFLPEGVPAKSIRSKRRKDPEALFETTHLLFDNWEYP